MSDDFRITPPLGYVVERSCNDGHPVVFKHAETGGIFAPLTVNNQLTCAVCLAKTINLHCAKPHLAFEVGINA